MDKLGIKTAVLVGALVAGAVPAARAWEPDPDLTPAPQSATWFRSDPAKSAGVVANGYIGTAWANGPQRSFAVTFAAPSSSAVTAGTGKSGGVDFTKPFVHVRVFGARDGALLEAAGVVDEGDHYPVRCEVLQNPSQWSAGKAGPSGTYRNWSGPSWTGVFADFTCTDGAGFDFYRASFAPGRLPDGSGAFVLRQWKDAPEPGLIVDWGPVWSQHWILLSAGMVSITKDGLQPSVMTLCGYRAGKAVECHNDVAAGGGNSTVSPFIWELNATSAGNGKSML